MKRRTVIKGAAALTFLPFAARLEAAAWPSRKDLQTDIDILGQALSLHPGLHRYNSPRQIESTLRALRPRFALAKSRREQYLLLSRFLACIRCGHTYASFFNQKSAVEAELFGGRTRLPFRFAWSGDRMIVLGDKVGELRPGTEILAIDGRSPAAIRAALMPLVRTDGHNDAKRVSLLEVRGEDSIETFDVFQGLIYPPRGDVFRINAREPGGRKRMLELAPIDLAERKAARSVGSEKGSGPLWTWDMRPDGVAVLTMPTWALYDSKWDWKPWLEERLDSLSAAKGMIVDLRANEGGEDCGDAIIARLIERDFAPPRVEERIRFERTPEALNQYLDTWDKSFRTLGVAAKPIGNGFFLRPGSDSGSRIEVSPKRLNIPVAVLIGPANSSATFHFAQNVRAIGRGRLYGQTTGGNRRGINGGAFFFVRLPSSELEFDLPLVGYFPLDPQPDSGLEPDVRITPDPADIAAGRDPVMARAIADLLRA